MLRLLSVALLAIGLSFECFADLDHRYPSGWPGRLDYGIYWVGSGDRFEKAGPAYVSDSSFYDKWKNTVIYFHGWTGGGDGLTVRSLRPSTNFCTSVELCPPLAVPEKNRSWAERWFAKGWNVGFFFWDQFADEPCPREAEQKIWTALKGKGLRWKSFNATSGPSSLRYEHYPAHSLADLCVERVEETLGRRIGGSVRFVGHSLGAQLATRCAALLHARDSPAAPSRVALLEPVFTQFSSGLLGCAKDEHSNAHAPVLTAAYLKVLYEKHAVVVEMYKSSLVSQKDLFGFPLTGILRRFGTFVTYHPGWCAGSHPSSFDTFGQSEHLNCRHAAVIPMYFLSYGQAPPLLVNVVPASVDVVASKESALRNCQTPSAACRDEDLLEWVQRQVNLSGIQKWDQSIGIDTFELRDDAYELTPGLSQSPTFVEKDSVALQGVAGSGCVGWLLAVFAPHLQVAHEHGNNVQAGGTAMLAEVQEEAVVCANAAGDDIALFGHSVHESFATWAADSTELFPLPEMRRGHFFLPWWLFSIVIIAWTCCLVGTACPQCALQLGEKLLAKGDYSSLGAFGNCSSNGYGSPSSEDDTEAGYQLR